jgi:hypothetical protein
MANTKISALTAATTPVAGTEVLPIVQSSTTKQLSIANLTAGRSVSAADYVMSTGNLVPSTAAKGINFTANTPAAGMTSQLLNWYEEGTWTPNQGIGLTVVGAFTSSGKYTRIGRQVTVNGAVAGATSISCTSGGVITTNLPLSTSGTAFVGSVGIANVNQGSTLIAYNTTVYCSSAITPCAGINFTVTYFV